MRLGICGGKRWLWSEIFFDHGTKNCHFSNGLLYFLERDPCYIGQFFLPSEDVDLLIETRVSMAWCVGVDIRAHLLHQRFEKVQHIFWWQIIILIISSSASIYWHQYLYFMVNKSNFIAFHFCFDNILFLDLVTHFKCMWIK